MTLKAPTGAAPTPEEAALGNLLAVIEDVATTMQETGNSNSHLSCVANTELQKILHAKQNYDAVRLDEGERRAIEDGPAIMASRGRA